MFLLLTCLTHESSYMWDMSDEQWAVTYEPWAVSYKQCKLRQQNIYKKKQKNKQTTMTSLTIQTNTI